MAATAPTVFVGGLGGSGTRAVAGALMAAGYYAGGCLNGANDNLIFTHLFKRPDWLRARPSPAAVDARLDLFADVMTRGVRPSALVRSPGLLRFRKDQGDGLRGTPDALGWMTKEPNSHIWLEPILERWPEAVFVYVSRHPLDMAFSDNKAQLANWSWLFDLDPDAFATPEAAQLEYWIRAQKRIDGLLARFAGRIHRLRFEAFTAAPEQELAALVETLGLPVPADRIAPACADVIVPDSSGRFRERDLAPFTDDQLAFCRAAGWEA